MAFHKDDLAGFLAQSSETSVLGRDVDGNLDLGNQGRTQVISSPLCPRSLIRCGGEWAKEQGLAAGFHKATHSLGAQLPALACGYCVSPFVSCPCSLWVVLPLRWQIPNHPEGRTGLSKTLCAAEFDVSCDLFCPFLSPSTCKVDPLTPVF